MLKISVIIPAYNEEYRILPSIEKIHSYLSTKKFDYEIIVVDDGSTDHTAEAVKKQGYAKIIQNPKNMGKGHATKTGMLAAKKDWILFTDADLSIPIYELQKFIKYIFDYDIIIGSKRMPETNVQARQPLHRKIPGAVFSWLVQLFCLKGIRDSQCGFKLFSSAAANTLFSKQTVTGFGFDVEILYLAQKYFDYRIKEVPVTLINDNYSRLSVLKDSFKMFFDILKILTNDLKGKYK